MTSDSPASLAPPQALKPTDVAAAAIRTVMRERMTR
jgi:hypothetical protein